MYVYNLLIFPSWWYFYMKECIWLTWGMVYTCCRAVFMRTGIEVVRWWLLFMALELPRLWRMGAWLGFIWQGSDCLCSWIVVTWIKSIRSGKSNFSNSWLRVLIWPLCTRENWEALECKHKHLETWRVPWVGSISWDPISLILKFVKEQSSFGRVTGIYIATMWMKMLTEGYRWYWEYIA